MKNIVAIIALSLCLVGCTFSEQESKNLTQSNLDNPEVIGQLNGHTLYRVEIVRPGNKPNHWVYFFDTNPTVTVNRTETQGKSTVNKVEVMINGKKFIAVEKE
jgi:hypothetical protein